MRRQPVCRANQLIHSGFFGYRALVCASGALVSSPCAKSLERLGLIVDTTLGGKAMASSASGIQLANQSAWQQFRLLQAERSADQAEQQARALRSQAEVAQRTADRAQENARSLQVDAREAESTAGEARRGVAMVRSVEEAVTQSVTRISATYDRTAAVQAAPAETTGAGAVVNSQGQMTGQLVSVAA